LEQQGFRVELVHNERWPAFTIGPQFSEENAGERDRILGVAVSFPLPLWRGNGSGIDAAKARQVQAETVLNIARLEVERRVVSAGRAYEIRLNEISRWRADAVNQFAEAAELADRHYRLAAVPATIYVELQKQYLDAVETLLDTRREAIAAAAELEELTGLELLGRP
jgi:cobalt-zinc-cadmium efflux system outer membrane protein